MSRLSRFLIVAVLGIALMPTAANAQFFGFGYPFGGYGFGGPYGGYGGFGGLPYGGAWPGGWPYIGMANGYGGGWGAYPASYTVTTPVVIIASTPASTYRRDVPVEPRVRPAVWPAIPYRAAPRTDARAELDLRVPAESAEVSLNGVPMRQQSGINRRFVTPVLEPGTYTFDVRVSWRDANGKEVTRTRQVEVRPGEKETIDFTGGS
jgi:uncharacterized protein (TIGR03000 family)